MRRVLVAFGLMAMLAGCGMTLPGRGGGSAQVDAPVAAAIAGEAIETTPLDAAPAFPAVTAAPPVAATPEPAPDPAPAAGAEAAPAPVTNAWPPAMNGAAQACTRTGGRFAAQGGGGAFACIRTPRDAGDSCRTGADCEGACLARSMTCAPVVPLFGCHEVVTASALRVTECLQ
ncbi:lipoprotein [Frigidibacter oleivorans]|uniref:lipoprotein n=1 Tax=Frigidibacter oleivorans TaxID=2487129 RepID=UPI000F8E8D55|nr:hypothetical protein [Frigidibacter oleivorans]